MDSQTSGGKSDNEQDMVSRFPCKLHSNYKKGNSQQLCIKEIWQVQGTFRYEEARRVKCHFGVSPSRNAYPDSNYEERQTKLNFTFYKITWVIVFKKNQSKRSWGVGRYRNYSQLKETKRHDDQTGEKIIMKEIMELTDETIDYGLNKSILSILNS